MEIGMLTQLLNAFVEAFSGGFDRIRPYMTGLFWSLATLDVVWFFLMVSFDIEPIRGGFKKLLTISIWSYVVQNFDQHANAVVESLIRAGFIVGQQGDLDARALLNPSAIMGGAFEATGPIIDQLMQVSMWQIKATWLMFGVIYLMMMLAYTWLAFTVLIALVEHYMALGITAILMPFGVLGVTRWIAMKPVSYFLATGIKLMVLAFIIAVSQKIFGAIRFAGEVPTIREMWIAFCVSGFISMLSWRAPERLASGIMAGSAALGASDLSGHAAMVASPVTTAASRVVSGATSKHAVTAYQAMGAVSMGAAGLAVAGAYAAGRGINSAYQRPASRSPTGAPQPGAAPSASGAPSSGPARPQLATPPNSKA